MRYAEGNHFAFPDCPEPGCTVRLHNVQHGLITHFAERGWSLAWGPNDTERTWTTPEPEWREKIAQEHDRHVANCQYCQKDKGAEGRA